MKLKEFFLAIPKVLFATLLLLFVLEGVSRLAGLPCGASRYIENIVVEKNLSAKKPKDEFRIFTYGESSMHGAHYWPHSNVPRWLGLYFKEALPGQKIRIMNFARMGAPIRFVYESFRDTVDYKPDIAVFYVGHNSFLPDNRVDEQDAKYNKPSAIARDTIQKSHFLSWIVRLVIRQKVKQGKSNRDRVGAQDIENPPSVMGEENIVYRTSLRYWQNIEEFRKRVWQIVELAEKKRIHAVFFMPVSNLKDFPPGHSVHFMNLMPDEQEKWEAFYAEGRKWQEEGESEWALAAYLKAHVIDPDYADLNFKMGQIYFFRKDYEKAKEFFIAAKENDAAIVRATKDMEAVLHDVRRSGRALVIETEPLVAGETEGGILGYPVIEDNVHFSVKGHALLAAGLMEVFKAKDWPVPASAWKPFGRDSFEVYSEKLGVTRDVLFKGYLQCASYFSNKFESRIRFAQKALELQPHDASATRHLAWSYWRKGEKEKAAEIYKQWIKKDPASAKEILDRFPEIHAAVHPADAVKTA